MLLKPSQAVAYETYVYEDDGQVRHLKWGGHRAGDPGGTVAWSLVPAGTPGSHAYCGDACPGASLDALNVEIAPGQGFAPVSLAALAPRIRAAFDRWSQATGIRFVRVGDDGAPIDAAGAAPPSTGHIRIGVFAFATGGGAVGYAPPPNGGTGAGDVLFDANSWYQFAPGGEGDPFSQTHAPNDFDSLLLHELGHAIGLAHPAYDGSCPVMQVDPACVGLINRELDPDDLAGARFLYGQDFRDGFE